jgi:hypothetical protein
MTEGGAAAGEGARVYPCSTHRRRSRDFLDLTSLLLLLPHEPWLAEPLRRGSWFLFTRRLTTGDNFFHLSAVCILQAR